MGLLDRLRDQSDANRLAALEAAAAAAATPAPLVIQGGFDTAGPVATDATSGGSASPYLAAGTAGGVRPAEVLSRTEGDGAWVDVGNASRGYRFEPLRGSAICPGGVSGCSDSGWLEGVDFPDLGGLDLPPLILGDLDLPPDFGFPGGPSFPPLNPWWSYWRPTPDKPGACNEFDVFNSCGDCWTCQDDGAGPKCVEKPNPSHCFCPGFVGCGACGRCNTVTGACDGVDFKCPPDPIKKDPPCECAPVCFNTGCMTECYYMSSCTDYKSQKGCEALGHYRPYGVINGVDLFPENCPECHSCRSNGKRKSSCVSTCDPCETCKRSGKGYVCAKGSKNCGCAVDGDCPKCGRCVTGQCVPGVCDCPPGGCGPCKTCNAQNKCEPVVGCYCTGQKDCGQCSQCIKGKCVRTGCAPNCTCTITTIEFNIKVTAPVLKCVCLLPGPGGTCLKDHCWCGKHSYAVPGATVSGCKARLPGPSVGDMPGVCGGSQVVNYDPFATSITTSRANGCSGACAGCF